MKNQLPAIPMPPLGEPTAAEIGCDECGQISNRDCLLDVTRKRIRVATLTSDDAHHHYLLSRLASSFDVVAAFIEPAAEQRKALLARGLWRPWFWSAAHSARRGIMGLDRYRRRYFEYTPVEPPVLPRVVRSINDSDVNDVLRQVNPDVVIVMGTSIIRHLPPQPAINIHGGFLPYYRGNNCIFFAMLNGDFDHVGSTLHFVDNGIDTGAVIEVVAPPVSPIDTPELAYCRAEREAIERLVYWLSVLQSGEQLPRRAAGGPGNLSRTRDRKLRHEVAFWWRWAIRRWREYTKVVSGGSAILKKHNLCRYIQRRETK